MIAKNIKGASFSGCVNYVSKEDSELLKAEGVFAENAKAIIESFEMQRSMRAEIKQPVGHIPISFAPEDRDKMSNEFMVKLAEEYMQKMGITNTQYVIIRHHDTENEHVHVVYNRINNDLKLISVHNDYKRNVATCKELKEKYNLTFGKDKSRVKREKLHGSETVKYAIHDIVKANLAASKDITELKIALYSSGVSMNLKCKRGSSEVQGVSFSMDGHKFKASQIDRKFSYKNILLQLRANKVAPKPPPPPAPKPSDDQIIAIYGVPLTYKQRGDFYAGKAIFLKDMVMNGQTISRYVRLLDDKRHVEVAEKNIPVEVGGVRLTNQQRNDLRSDKSVMISGAKIDGEILDKLWLKYSNEQSCIMGSFRDPDAISSGDSTIISYGQRQHLQPPQPSLQPQYEEHHTQSYSDESSSGALSLFDIPSSGSGADQDDIDNAEMAKDLQQKKKRRGMRM